MSNFRERMMSKTAEVRAAKDIQIDQQQEKPTSPRTAPGMAGGLAQAQQRIVALEKAGTASDANVSEIVPNPWQPRKVFNEAKLTQLAESIREAGLVQPIIVRRAAQGHQIVAGERRWRAHKVIGKETIKASSSISLTKRWRCWLWWKTSCVTTCRIMRSLALSEAPRRSFTTESV
jgi:ParB family chromosome partitioning protein